MARAVKGDRVLPKSTGKVVATKKATAKKVAPVRGTTKPATTKPATTQSAAPNGVPTKRASRKAVLAPAAQADEAATATLEVDAPLAKMTPKEERFVAEYLIDPNGTQAYMRAYPRANATTARTEAAMLLRKPAVAAAVEAGKRRLSERAEVKAEEVVRRLGLMATADERELMEVHVGCCRHCWGKGGRYQYTAAEFERAEAEHAAAVERDKASGDFDPKGGVGFNANARPNPDCPECFGDGKPRAIFKDTRHLSEGAALLFAGVKETRDGFEVKTHSREAALVNLARIHSLFNDTLKLKGKVEIDATEELKQFLRERPSRLPLAASYE